jgi:hypothetical protein
MDVVDARGGGVAVVAVAGHLFNAILFLLGRVKVLVGQILGYMAEISDILGKYPDILNFALHC